MGDLSAHFDSSEFQCPDCLKAEMDSRLIEGLEELRHLAGRPIRVLSGYRCEAHNQKVGGKPLSQHLYGKAADIVIEHMSMEEAALLAEHVPAFASGGIGRYPHEGFIHVDVRDHIARWWRNKQGTYVA